MYVRSGTNAATYLGVVDVVDFIEDNKLDVSDQIGTLVEHASQDLGRHLLLINKQTPLDSQ